MLELANGRACEICSAACHGYSIDGVTRCYRCEVLLEWFRDWAGYVPRKVATLGDLVSPNIFDLARARAYFMEVFPKGDALFVDLHNKDKWNSREKAREECARWRARINVK